MKPNPKDHSNIKGKKNENAGLADKEVKHQYKQKRPRKKAHIERRCQTEKGLYRYKKPIAREIVTTLL
jgi:hypothetical protein